MFKKLLVGTAFTLLAASTTLSPAFAKGVPFNYSDPCKTAFANFQQAKWQESHRTEQGNLGGAAGWDELADAADKSAQTQRARADERRQNAKDNPGSADFWNNQAKEADAEAKDWDDTAERHRAEAKKMREDGKDYDEAAKKALLECMTFLIAEGETGSQVHLGLIARDKGLKKIFGNSLDETEALTEVNEPTQVEEKAEKAEPKVDPAPPQKKKQVVKKPPKPEKTKKQTRVQKSGNQSQNMAQSIARDVAVSVASQLILGEITGMRHKRERRHSAEPREMMDGMAMEEFQPRRKMKIKKLMGVGFGMF